MKKSYKRCLAGALCLCMALPLCSCGIVREVVETASTVTEGTNAASEEETAETAPEATEAPAEGIKVREQNLVPKDSVKPTEDSGTPAEGADGNGSEVSGSSEQEQQDDSAFTAEDAKDILSKGIHALVDEDWEAVMLYTNMGDIYRLADEENKYTPDDVILEELKSGVQEMDMTEWREDASSMIAILDSVPEPQYMTAGDLGDINNTLKDLVDMSGGNRWTPAYYDGYKFDITNGDGIGYFYVLQDRDGVWKYDICFGTMRDGLSYLENYQKTGEWTK